MVFYIKNGSLVAEKLSDGGNYSQRQQYKQSLRNYMAYKNFVSASTVAMWSLMWRSGVACVIPVLHAKVPENALEEECSCIMGERLSNE
ncbi:hypothetical protein TNCV_1442851 [Trichonephila clavipes]|nr:hypothetical protein TNCV_1442851 [Trichonephila clavipes]